jgi:hypothetical protein
VGGGESVILGRKRRMVVANDNGASLLVIINGLRALKVGD